jgi:NADH dehydrogenase FAD-containing subunit
MEISEATSQQKTPVVVIVGGGFGGLSAAQALKKAPVKVILIDRANHHLFQPLLYQVATAALSPGQIGFPIRDILRSHRNSSVILGEVTGVDAANHTVIVDSPDHPTMKVSYDYLVIATGARHSYFGHDQYEKFAPGLKTLADAVAIRNRILLSFEKAEVEPDPVRQRELLTFVLIGAGPTGVELASAIANLSRSRMKHEFRRIDSASARIVLIDMANRPLGPFAPDLSEEARQRLLQLGVELRLGHGIDTIDENGVVLAGERITCHAIFWTAGVAPSPAGKWLGAETDRAGRVRVGADLTVQDHSQIFVIGDTASCDQHGAPLPGVAQVAMQQGRYVGKLIQLRISGGAPLAPFRYFDKGNLAVVGKGFAVLQSGKVHLSGRLAWCIWAFVHLEFLGQASQRASVLLQWLWTYTSGQRGSQIIVRHRCD